MSPGGSGQWRSCKQVLKKDVLHTLGLAWVEGVVVSGPVLPRHTGRLCARSVPHGWRLCGQENLQCEDTTKPEQRQPGHDFLSSWKGLSNRGFLRAAEVWQ